MPTVKIDAKALSDHAAALADIAQRTDLSIRELAAGGQAVLRRIDEEIATRQRILAEREQAYNACQQRGKGGCDELYRKMLQARRALETARQARRQAEAALTEFRSRSTVLGERMERLSTAGQSTLAKLRNDLVDYSAFAGLVPAALLTAAASAANPSPVFSAATRTATAQSYQRTTIGRREVLVFDHPARSAKNAVITQGSARPASFLGTCGLCASGSLIRKAGGDADEARMIDFAVGRGLCRTEDAPHHNGGTSGRNLVDILRQSAGLSAHCDVGLDADELALAIEQGRGVILGVAPALLGSGWYGPYDPNAAGGHWIVLESVVRDARTNAILGFVIIDSNGDTPAAACQSVSLSTLLDAYTANGGVSVITDHPIW